MAPKPPTPRNYPTAQKPFEVPPDGTAPKPPPPRPVELPKHVHPALRKGGQA
jgi:hypothetical protein